MKPGQHFIVLGNVESSLPSRYSGLEVRDSILIVTEGPNLHVAWLLRYPLSGSVAETALTYGTGAIQVRACRVATDQLPAQSKGPGFGSQIALNAAQGFRGKDYYEGTSFSYKPDEGGRWPPNTLLVHSSSCTLLGSKFVKGDKRHGKQNELGVRGSGFANVGAQAGSKKPNAKVQGDSMVPRWECSENCPAGLLDAQSGTLSSGTGSIKKATSKGYAPTSYGKDNRPLGTVNLTHGDSGGASRFYPQFKNMAEALDWLAKLISVPQ